ncbi:hypothetical protein D3C72_1686960 [compost metagenome]
MQRAGTGVAQQVPVGRVQIDDLLFPGRLGGIDQRVVQQLGCRCAFAANGGIAVQHEQPVGIGLEDEFERDRLAVARHLDVLVGRRNAVHVVQHAKA